MRGKEMGCPHGSQRPLWLLRTFTVGWPASDSLQFHHIGKAPQEEKRDHFRNICREPLWTALQLPWKLTLGNCFNFREIATNNNKHK